MPRLAVFLLLAVAALTIPTTRGLNPRKLDDTTGENKCGGCPCNNPYCPPPPGGGYVPSGPTTPNNQYIYFNGPPGNLYPVDQYFSGAGKVGFSLLIAGAFLGFLALFW
nr:cytokinesis protein sepA-like [Ipomoea batatas]